jgi:hypothetical protein
MAALTIADYEHLIQGEANLLAAQGFTFPNLAIPSYYAAHDYLDYFFFNNQIEQAFFQSNQQATYLPFLDDILLSVQQINGHLQSAGTVSLSETNDFLFSIDQQLLQIGASVRGGLNVDLASVVTALDVRLKEIAKAVEVAGDSTGGGLFDLVSTLSFDIPGTFGHAVNEDLNKINDTLQLLAQIAALTANVKDPATQRIADNTLDAARLNFISSGAPILAGMPGLDTLSGFLNALKNGEAISGLVDMMETTVASVPDAIMDKTSRDEWARFFKTARETGFLSAWKQSSKDVIKAAVDFATPSVKSLFEVVGTIAEAFEPALKAIFQPAFDSMLGVVKHRVASQGMVSPTQGFNAAGEWLAAAASAGMHAHHLAELLEMLPYTKTFGLNMLPAFLADMAGFGQIAQQTWGKAIGEGVGRPAGYEINALMRSKIPDEGALRASVQRRALSIEEFSTLMTYHGYHDNYIAMAVDTVWRNPSLREILLLVQDTPIAQDDVVALLLDAGYSQDLITRVMPALMRKRTINERAQLVGEVRASLAQGFITEEDARLQFDFVGMSADEQELSLATARMAFRRGRMADNLATLQNEFTSNLMEAADFTLAARAQGISEPRIASELASIEVKRHGTVAHQEIADAKAEVRHQQSLILQEFRVLFQHGLVDAGGFENALTHAGILPATAHLTVELERVKLEGRAGNARSPAAARAVAAEMKIREDTFVELFRKNLITNLQLGSFLHALGLTDSLVDAIVRRELARRIPTAADLAKTPAGMKAKEVFTLAKSTLQVQFAKGAIDADDYLNQLVLLGVDETVARATVKLEVAKRSGEKQPPKAAATDSKALGAVKAQVADLEKQAADGKITAEDLAAALDRIGLLEQTVDALLAQLDEERQAAAAAPTA